MLILDMWKLNTLYYYSYLFSDNFFTRKFRCDEEFKSRISWLLPSEEILPFSDNLNKVRGYNKRRGGFQVDGILYSNLPIFYLVE